MIHGAHFLLYSTNADADRGFFQDVLKLKSVDVGRGWLIFKLPPSELAVHPNDEGSGERGEESGSMPTELYLMCKDLAGTLKMLKTKGVAHAEPQTAPWGTHTTIVLPSGGRIGIYQPGHPEAIALP